MVISHTENDSLNFVKETSVPAETSILAQALFGKVVQDINLKLIEGIPYEKVLDYIFESIGLLIPYDRMGIALVDDAGEKVTLSWVRSKTLIQNLRQNYSAPLKSSSLATIFETGKPRIINDLKAYLAAHPESASTRLILKDGIRSNLTCPLMAQNRRIGIVFFSCSKENCYSDRHISIFTHIAGELSLIVEHGRLQNYFSDNDMKTQNLRTIVHDLRGPLSVIQGYLDICVEESWYHSLSSETQKIFLVLQKNVQYMFQLIDNLSNLQQSQIAGLKIQNVKLTEFLQDVVNAGQVLAQKKEISFHATIQNLPSSAEFDAEKIYRVFNNLIANAVKFSYRHKSIYFLAEARDQKLYFSIADQGQGISKTDLSKLFRKDGKTSTLPTEDEKSTGLGLSIVKKIIEQHGGEISVVSQVGQGSTFEFWIPIKTHET